MDDFHFSVLKIKLICRKELGVTDAEFFSLSPQQVRELLNEHYEREIKERELELKFYDLLHAEMMSLHCNINRDHKKTRAVKPENFLHFATDKKYPTSDELLEKMKVITKQLKSHGTR